MPGPSNFIWPFPTLRTGALGYNPDTVDPEPESPDPTDWAHSSNSAYIEVANISFTVEPADDVNLAATITNDARNTATRDFVSIANVHDDDDTTYASTPGFAGSGSVRRGLVSDLGSAVLVETMRTRAGVSGTGSAPSYVEHSSDGSSWTTAPGTWTGTGSVRIFTLDTPTSARYWAVGFIDPGPALRTVGWITWDTWSISGEAVTEGGVEWSPAPRVNDGSDATYNTANADGACLRVALEVARLIYRAELRIACENAGSKTYELYGSTDAAFTSPVLLDSVTFTGTGSFTAQEVVLLWTPTEAYQYFQLEGPDETRRFHDLNLFSAAGLGVTDHPSLTERDAADQHPASAVSVDTSGFVNSDGDDVQEVLADLDALLGTVGAEDVEVVAISGASVELDYDVARYWDITLSQNCTLTIANPPADQTWGQLVVILRQSASAPDTVTWPAEVQWADTDGTPGGAAPTLFTTDGAVDVVTLVTVDGGVTWGGSHSAGGGATIDYAEAGDLAAVGTTAAAGSSDEIPRADHVHAITKAALAALGYHGPLLLASDHATPFTFDEILQASDGSDFLYASEP